VQNATSVESLCRVRLPEADWNCNVEASLVHIGNSVEVEVVLAVLDLVALSV